MDNKLSELRKPVMYSLRFRNMHTGEPDKTINANTTFSTLEKAKSYGLGSRYVTQDDGKIVNVRDPSQDPIVEPLYSQEYVSALMAELEASKKYAKERDDENESLALTVGRLRVELHNEGAANAHAYERIRGLEKQLATPVRLPEPDVNDYGYESIGYRAVLSALSDAGFTVEGDEQ